MIRRPVVKPLATRQPGRPSSTTSDVEVMHLCGHRALIKVYGDPAKSTYLAMMQDRDCNDCYRVKMVEVDHAASVAGTRCFLAGGPKAVPWAQAIRQRRHSELGAWYRTTRAVGESLVTSGQVSKTSYRETLDDAKQAFADLMRGVEFEDGVHSGEASFWIESRDLKIDELVARLLPHRDVLGAGVWSLIELATDHGGAVEVFEDLDLDENRPF